MRSWGHWAVALLCILIIVPGACMRGSPEYYEGRINAALHDLNRPRSLRNAEEVLRWCLRMQDCATSVGQRDRARALRIAALRSFCELYEGNMELLYENAETTHGKRLAALQIASNSLGSGSLLNAKHWLDKYSSIAGDKDPKLEHAQYVYRAHLYRDLGFLSRNPSCYEECLRCYEKALEALPAWGEMDAVHGLLESAVELYRSAGAPGKPVEYWRKRLGLEDVESSTTTAGIGTKGPR